MFFLITEKMFKAETPIMNVITQESVIDNILKDRVDKNNTCVLKTFFRRTVFTM